MNDKIIPKGIKAVDAKAIGAHVRLRRKAMGLTQKRAAGICNVGVRFISDLENGKSALHLGKAIHVLRAFGIDLYMIDREDA